MHYTELFSEDLLQEMLKAKLINEQFHIEFPLRILNYSNSCSTWNEATLNCRGLIVDLEGNIIARSPKKFFNEYQRDHGITTETLVNVTYKWDGVLAIPYIWDDQIFFATRGSFHSPMAEAMNANLDHYANYLMRSYISEELLHGNTPVYEFINPEFKIIVDYGDEDGLKGLGAVSHETGKFVYRPSSVLKHSAIPFREAIELEIPQGEEGFVVDVVETGDAVKLKSKDYLRIASILANLSKHTVWDEFYFEDRPIDDSALDDEIVDAINAYRKELSDGFDKLIVEFMNDFTEFNHGKEDWNRKDFAQAASKHPLGTSLVTLKFEGRIPHQKIDSMKKSLRPFGKAPLDFEIGGLI